MPAVFWISAFTYPTGFTTALKQKHSRRGGQNPIPIDKLEFDFSNIYQNEAALIDQPKDGGAFIKGLFLEGAKWDGERNVLEDADSMVLNFSMPIIHFKPVSKKPKSSNIYNCPCYYYPIRAGSVSRDSFMLPIDLKCGDYPPEFWVKRGTALLLSLAI